jgi:hypothetical protein
MIIVAYLLTIMLVPTLSALMALPLAFYAASIKSKLFFPILTLLIGIISGFATVFLCKMIFSGLSLKFSSTPIWVLFTMYLLHDLGKVSQSSSKQFLIVNVGQLLGSPIGLYSGFQVLG